MIRMDYGELLDHPEGVLFRSARSGRFVAVEDMAQGARGFIEAFFDETVSVLFSDIETQHRPRMLLHHVARHRDIARRAYAISSSAESASAEGNWWRAERELLPGLAPAGPEPK